ncbi:hypothetical protein C8A00DRAFT_36386 [Chaetomidium leptoderma]|uniref:BTB domain-containing protein n=1 Tax=Chaetomidium leptoderma TaxID=669021 RepID=A0AAN6VHM1_9PEZI|nr:hypothetical protein C8A00DRAFT_36386 [Chaetomidium leptoderma]
MAQQSPYMVFSLYDPEPGEVAAVEEYADMDLSGSSRSSLDSSAELVEMNPGDDLCGVTIRFDGEIWTYGKKDLIAKWPYFQRLHDMSQEFARGEGSIRVYWRDATISDVSVLLDFIFSSQTTLDLDTMYPGVATFPACVKAYLAGKLFHRGLAKLAVHALADHCDQLLVTAFHCDSLTGLPTEDVAAMFESVSFTKAVQDTYHPAVTADTAPIRNILIPFLWIMQRRIACPCTGFINLAKVNKNFAADIGLYVLSMDKRNTSFEPRATSHDISNRFYVKDKDYIDRNSTHGCHTCRPSDDPRGRGAEEDDAWARGQAEWFDPFVTTAVWQHTRYWCKNCAEHMDRSVAPWRTTSLF